MGDLIEREKLEKALTAAAANDKDKNLRAWAKAICVLHDAPAVDAVPAIRKHCDFCGRGKSIKAFTILPNGLQYGTSIMATYCPNCGAELKKDKKEKA